MSELPALTFDKLPLLRKIDAGIRLSEHLDGKDGPYRSGRSPHWIRVKNPNAPGAMRSFE
jgi:hypothetical protein